MSPVLALVHAWLVLDFFGESRRRGSAGSTLTTAVFGQSFVGFLFALITLPDFTDGSRFVAFATANLSLSSLLIGIGALADPQRAERVRADEILLRTAPVGRGKLVLARLLHGGFSTALVTIGMALPAAILSYWVSGGSLAVVPGYLALACVLAGLTSGALSALTAAATRVLGRARGELIGASSRGVLFAGGFVGFALCLPHLGGSADDIPGGRWLANAWPPYWGGRLLGSPADSWLFALALAGTAALLFAVSVGLQRARSDASRAARASVLARLDRWMVGEGPLLGVTAFTSTMLFRSSGFRAKVLPIFGLPVAMIGMALLGAEPRGRMILVGVSLQLPAIYLPLLVGFLAKADHEGSRWVFATSPVGLAPDLAQRAAWVSLATHVLFPAHAIALAVMLVAGMGLVASISLSCFSLGLAVLVAGFALRTLEAPAFTDETEGVSADSGAMLAMAFVLGTAGGAFALVAGEILALPAAVALLVLSVFRLRRPNHA